MKVTRYLEDTEVVITNGANHMRHWIGMKCVVVHNCNTPDILTFVKPHSVRPDGLMYEPFFWLTKNLEEA